MKFITAEEFEKQPLEVRETLMDWWKPQIGDFVQIIENKPEIIIGYSKHPPFYKTFNFNKINNYLKQDMIPLFTEEQLRNFIEEREGKIRIIEYDFDHYNIVTGKLVHITGKKDLLQAYWKTACSIAMKIVIK